jgi:ferric-dicitrate binding protein FerR (iron transport regulator)
MENHSQATQDEGQAQEQIWDDFAKQRNPLQAHQNEGPSLRQALRRSILLVLLCLASIGLLVVSVIAMLQLLSNLRAQWWDERYIGLLVLFCGLLFVAAFGIAVKELVLAWKRVSPSQPR